MEYEFYIDLFFLTTLFYNFLSLYLSSIFLKKIRKYRRLLFSSAAGSLWNCLLILFPIIPETFEMLLTIFLPGIIMLMIAFKICDPKKLLPASGTLLISAVIVGGIVSFLKQRLFLRDWEILVLAAGLCCLSERFLKGMFKTTKLGSKRYTVRLFYRGKIKEFLALADSGNRLKVPGTGAVVSLIAKEDCIDFCDHIGGGFYVPYRSVGIGHGILFATTFEKMEIDKDDETVCIDKPVVAFSLEGLSEDRSFSMILPEEYVR